MLLSTLMIVARQPQGPSELEWATRKCAIGEVLQGMCPPDQRPLGYTLTAAYLDSIRQETSTSGLSIDARLCRDILKLVERFSSEEQETQAPPLVTLDKRYKFPLAVQQAVDAMAALNLAASVEEDQKNNWNLRVWQSAVWGDSSRFHPLPDLVKERKLPVGAVIEHVLASKNGRVWEIRGWQRQPCREALDLLNEGWITWFDAIVATEARTLNESAGVDGEDLARYIDIASYLNQRRSEEQFGKRLKRLDLQGQLGRATILGVRVGRPKDSLVEIEPLKASPCLVLLVKNWVYEFSLEGGIRVTLTMSDVGSGEIESGMVLRLAKKDDKGNESYVGPGAYKAYWDAAVPVLFLSE